jgi:hypothetical protein
VVVVVCVCVWGRGGTYEPRLYRIVRVDRLAGEVRVHLKIEKGWRREDQVKGATLGYRRGLCGLVLDAEVGTTLR